MTQPLQGKHAVITGGSSGIGLATAMAFAKRGATLSLIARDEQKLKQAKLKVQQHYPVTAAVFSCDISDYAAIANCVNEIGQHSQIDFLVCNAGTMICGKIEDNTIEDLNRTMEINYTGTLNTYKSAIPFMKVQGKGQIGFVSSVAGYLGAIGYGGYSPGKFAIAGLAECVRMEAIDHGIGTTIIFPPDTDTPFLTWERTHTIPECKALSKNAKVISAEKVAEKLVRGMLKNKFEVFCNTESRLIRVFKVVWPSLYFRVLDGVVRKDRKKRGVL